MNLFLKTINYITSINKWAAYFTSILMVVMVGIFAAARTLGYPIVGDIELVQFTMVLMIVFSLAYTEKTDSHVSITLLYDRLPYNFQLVLKLAAKVLTIAFCFLVCWVFLSKMEFSSTSSLLKIVFYPFKVMLIIGFFAWGLEAFQRFIVELKERKAANNAVEVSENVKYFANGE
ncbi:TRAP transporter small permease [Alkalihalobacillus sp. BA299]|uniref:TRAP transporter small permease n=1 Tax=Alkalihalobacillus sp. BA299 TaxID=2815938 RepID=UPI001AD9D3E1|nr:TRAP transporter small permease [Alkalihalobacillus sp. BA299]